MRYPTALLTIGPGLLWSIAFPIAAETTLFSDITDDALDVPFRHVGATVDVFPEGAPFGPPVGEPAELNWLAGVAIGDFNGDGWSDLFVTNGRGGANALYLNRADGQASFIEAANTAGVAFAEDEAAAAVAADFDADGRLDLYVANIGLDFGPSARQAFGPNRLFLNRGNQSGGVPLFEEVGDITQAGGDPFTRSQLPSLSDFDRDGDLDMFIAAHTNRHNPQFPSDSPMSPVALRDPQQAGLLLRNLLRETGQLRFENATDLLRFDLSGILGRDERPIHDSRATFDGVWVDYDNDGDPDLLQANDLGVIGAWRNESGAFRYVSSEVGFSAVGAWMSIAPGDINGDGYLDIFASNGGRAAANIPTFTNNLHALHLGQSNGTFQDVAERVGVGNPPRDGDTSGDFGWGAQMFDFDNDGDLDLFFAGNWWGTGFGTDDPFGSGVGGHTNAGHLFENTGTDAEGRPVLVDLMASEAGRKQVGIDHRFDVRSVAVGDLDNDGYLDLVLGNTSGRATRGNFGGFASLGHYDGGLKIYRNNGNGHRQIRLRLVGTVSNRSGIGARVLLRTLGRRQIREVRAGEGHLSHNSLDVEFGIGNRWSATVDVRWPAGFRNRFFGARPGAAITFPEIPCSIDDPTLSLQDYVSCVRRALQEVVATGVLDHREFGRFFVSAIIAFFQEH